MPQKGLVFWCLSLLFCHFCHFANEAGMTVLRGLDACPLATVSVDLPPPPHSALPPHPASPAGEGGKKRPIPDPAASRCCGRTPCVRSPSSASASTRGCRATCSWGN